MSILKYNVRDKVQENVDVARAMLFVAAAVGKGSNIDPSLRYIRVDEHGRTMASDGRRLHIVQFSRDYRDRYGAPSPGYYEIVKQTKTQLHITTSDYDGNYLLPVDAILNCQTDIFTPVILGVDKFAACLAGIIRALPDTLCIEPNYVADALTVCNDMAYVNEEESAPVYLTGVSGGPATAVIMPLVLTHTTR